MLLALRALLVLGLASLLCAARKDQMVSSRLGWGSGLKVNRVKLVLDPSVLPLSTQRSSSDIANMSLTPWKYREEDVPSRFPKVMAHAECLTTGCLSLQGGGEDQALEAKPIYYQVLVLKRVLRKSHSKKSHEGKKARKRYDFMLGTETVAVGCTCVRPSIIPQQ
ncbi:interleukin 17a/f3 [Mugil cephalus]|uniref:interleukin 17a/f3 n=1 Tax=Mugil cephalus TaxID=48193 RepID=UPI001FB74BF4|nr:interleukin 17a/f3 [Mugil cephalus]